jgi:hypothetical protein
VLKFKNKFNSLKVNVGSTFLLCLYPGRKTAEDSSVLNLLKRGAEPDRRSNIWKIWNQFYILKTLKPEERNTHFVFRTLINYFHTFSSCELHINSKKACPYK